MPENFLPRHPFNEGFKQSLRSRIEVDLLPAPRTAKDVQAELAAYYAVISHLDEQVGRILAALKTNGQLDNTVVIFASDHGIALGSHGLMGKQNMYEHTIGVPLILRGPGIPKSQRRDAQVYLRDLFPTTCDMVGVAIPKTVEGRSMRSVIEGRQRQLYRYVFGYFRDKQRMIRGNRWKLISYPALKRLQLFDLANDPLELSDLSQKTEFMGKVAELKKELTAWQRTVGDH